MNRIVAPFVDPTKVPSSQGKDPRSLGSAPFGVRHQPVCLFTRRQVPPRRGMASPDVISSGSREEVDAGADDSISDPVPPPQK
jgi:hypothetical protein